MEPRIVISGMGIVSALGAGLESTMRALRESKSGIADIAYLATSHQNFPVGEVKWTDEQMMEMLGIVKETPHTRTSLMGTIAIKEALRQAGIDVFFEYRDRLAFINGTTVGGMDKTERYYLDFEKTNEYDAYISIHDCGKCSEIIADNSGVDFYQIQTISTACSSAANAILTGAMLLENGVADMVVAGGCECLTRFHLNGFITLKILDTVPCRPFDANRNGINLGEGAAYVVMETEEHFYKRMPTGKVRPLCLLSGYANTCDAYHQTASSPQGDGAFMAMRQALGKAGLQPGQIDYINAHGTGTVNNDLSEAAAIVRVFGEKIPPVSSTKAYTGHTTSAAGGIEAVVSILALQNNFIPANLNFANQAEDIPFKPQQEGECPNAPLVHVLSNSFGFGGNCTSLVFSKYSWSEK
ncbi:MAG: beta-ketoacyl-[acyl-carrier-protein] synthase family protein [Bacteroides sp.]|nr:beta-ketoacyl-[acyl-carrier-protein] synthase family protein [Bacteroides sp.]MCM1084875.1 beta-ketoacyl-[acyl-carrier-protein] synthase family protein [Bacteroides sp.]